MEAKDNEQPVPHWSAEQSGRSRRERDDMTEERGEVEVAVVAEIADTIDRERDLAVTTDDSTIGIETRTERGVTIDGEMIGTIETKGGRGTLIETTRETETLGIETGEVIGTTTMDRENVGCHQWEAMRAIGSASVGMLTGGGTVSAIGVKRQKVLVLSFVCLVIIGI